MTSPLPAARNAARARLCFYFSKLPFLCFVFVFQFPFLFGFLVNRQRRKRNNNNNHHHQSKIVKIYNAKFIHFIFISDSGMSTMDNFAGEKKSVIFFFSLSKIVKSWNCFVRYIRDGSSCHVKCIFYFDMHQSMISNLFICLFVYLLLILAPVLTDSMMTFRAQLHLE